LPIPCFFNTAVFSIPLCDYSGHHETPQNYVVSRFVGEFARKRKKNKRIKVTRSFMKLFKTGSATVVSGCQKFFRFLPVTYKIDIRIANFLEKFISSDNSLCIVFKHHAVIGINRIYSTYGDTHSVPSWDMFLTNYLLTVSHLDLLWILLLCYSIITWYNPRCYLKPWMVVICTCSAFCCYCVCCRFSE